jgi:hypothetical protein
MIGDISTVTTTTHHQTQVVAFTYQDLVLLALDRALSDGNGFIGEPAKVELTLAWAPNEDEQKQITLPVAGPPVHFYSPNEHKTHHRSNRRRPLLLQRA